MGNGDRRNRSGSGENMGPTRQAKRRNSLDFADSLPQFHQSAEKNRQEEALQRRR